MITTAFVRTMAAYNTWQNRSVFDAASSLNDAQRRENRGAFFGSIHATLNHVLWADRMWLSRFGAAPPPVATTITEGLDAYGDWNELSAERHRVDAVIESWAAALEPEALAGDLKWFSGATGREMTQPRQLLMIHIFNHQTHHRGQVNALLTGFGIKPGITDLPFGPPLQAG